MSEASPHLRPQQGPARRDAEPPDPTSGPFSFNSSSYPLDPPLVDVRIPVSEPHAAATAYSRAALRHRFPDAQVGDDLHMLFSEPGEVRQSRLSPDVFVALDVPRRGTRSDYDADLLGPPDFVLEVVSRSTWKHDLGRKLDCYQRLGVRECLFFDATRADLDRTGEELWGFALTPRRRQPLAEAVLPNGERGIRSAVLGLVAYVAERTPPAEPRETWALTMRWHDPATGEHIPDYDEVRAKADAERARGGAARQEWQAARSRANAARHEALAHRTRTEATQRRIAELEAQLRRLRDEA